MKPLLKIKPVTLPKLAGEPKQFFCRRCGYYLGTFDKYLAIKCSICFAVTTYLPGKIHWTEKNSPEIKKSVIAENIRKFQNLFRFGKKEL